MRVNPEIWKQGAPETAGFYAVLVCWDAVAGRVPDEIEVEDAGEIFPACLYWTGARWDADDAGGKTYDPVIRWNGPWSTPQIARTFSWEHEPGRTGGVTDDEVGDLPEADEL